MCTHRGIFSIPYWSVVIPLTTISAFLLLTKPRHSNQKNVSELITEKVAKIMGELVSRWHGKFGTVAEVTVIVSGQETGRGPVKDDDCLLIRLTSSDSKRDVFAPWRRFLIIFMTTVVHAVWTNAVDHDRIGVSSNSNWLMIE